MEGAELPRVGGFRGGSPLVDGVWGVNVSPVEGEGVTDCDALAIRSTDGVMGHLPVTQGVSGLIVCVAALYFFTAPKGRNRIPDSD